MTILNADLEVPGAEEFESLYQDAPVDDKTGDQDAEMNKPAPILLAPVDVDIEIENTPEQKAKRKAKRTRTENPSFTFFPRDVLAWPDFQFLTSAQLGDWVKLVTYASMTGGILRADHPLLGSTDAAVIRLCTMQVDDGVALVVPLDLPKLLDKKKTWVDSRRSNSGGTGRDDRGRFQGKKA